VICDFCRVEVVPAILQVQGQFENMVRRVRGCTYYSFVPRGEGSR
jgi:hypothetical protein